MKGLICLFPFLLPGLLSAQLDYDPSDLLRINQAYTDYPDMEVHIAYRLFEDHSTRRVFQEEEARLKRSADRIWYRIAEMEHLITGDYALLLDHQEKTLTLMPRHSAQQQPFDALAQMEEILALCERVMPLDEKNSGYRGYRMDVPLPEMERIDLYFEGDTYLIRKLVFYYRVPEVIDYETEDAPKVKARLELHYDYLDTDARFASGTFSLQQYLTRSGGKYKCLPDFADYQFTDLSGTTFDQ